MINILLKNREKAMQEYINLMVKTKNNIDAVTRRKHIRRIAELDMEIEYLRRLGRKEGDWNE